MSVYQLKPRFQSLLRPLVRQLHSLGVTANQVTVFACLVSVVLGLWLYAEQPIHWAFVCIPLWMLLRMAFNAIDGMLAREHGQQTRLGAFLNELTDVLSDAALYLPFAAVAPFSPLWVGVVIVLSGLSEFAGALGPTVGASRRYDGPLGKSDRALVLGALGFYVATGAPLPEGANWVFPLLAIGIAWTAINRVRRALAEVSSGASLS